jgi:nucleotide-binding universal stress UspA family protein
MFKDILLPTDGSKGVDEAINCAVAVAKKFNATIHVLFVVEPPRFLDFGAGIAAADIVPSIQEAGKQIISDTAQVIRDSGVFSVKEAIKQGHPAEEIIRYAKEEGIDLIVMGTHGRRGLNRVLLGSVAEEVVRSADVPVMTVRMTEE